MRGWSHEEDITTILPELRDRAVRMVQEHLGEYGSQWTAVVSIADKVGCTPERDRGLCSGPTTDEQARMKALERE